MVLALIALLAFVLLVNLGYRDDYYKDGYPPE